MEGVTNNNRIPPMCGSVTSTVAQRQCCCWNEHSWSLVCNTMGPAEATGNTRYMFKFLLYPYSALYPRQQPWFKSDNPLFVVW